MAPNRTLVTEVTIRRTRSVERLHDCVTTVEDLRRTGRSRITIESPDIDISIDLTGAERIALIEALGGKA